MQFFYVAAMHGAIGDGAFDRDEPRGCVATATGDSSDVATCNGALAMQGGVAGQTSASLRVCFFSELQFSITSVSIYYGTQSDIRVKSYCRLNLLRASVFNYERLDILRDSIGHPSKKLLFV